MVPASLNRACDHKLVLAYLTCLLFPQVIDRSSHLVVVLRALQSRSKVTVIKLHVEADSFKTNLSLKGTGCNIHVAKVLSNQNF